MVRCKASVASCSKFVGFLGTTLGPHVVRAGERPARRCTPCTPTSRPHTARDLRKCVTAIFWGSSGRRFKLPRSPRLGCAWRIQFRNAAGGRSTARPAGGSRAWDPTPDTTAPRAQATRRGYLLFAASKTSFLGLQDQTWFGSLRKNRGTTHRAQLRGFGYSDNDRVDPSDSVPRMPGWGSAARLHSARRACARPPSKTSIKAARGPRTGTPCADVTESRCDSGVFWPRPLQDRGANFSYSSAR
jgi:hypothetical protein